MPDSYEDGLRQAIDLALIPTFFDSTRSMRMTADALERGLRKWDRERVPSAAEIEAQTEAATIAMQDWWNDFCIDTGDHPDFVYRIEGQLAADFFQARPMIEAALLAARSVTQPETRAR